MTYQGKALLAVCGLLYLSLALVSAGDALVEEKPVASAHGVPENVKGEDAVTGDIPSALASRYGPLAPEAPEQPEGPLAPEEVPASAVQEAPPVVKSMPAEGPAAPTSQAVKKPTSSLPPRAQSNPASPNTFVEVRKPELLDSLRHYVKKFLRQDKAESCMNIVTEMEQNESTAVASKHLFVLLEMLDHENHEGPSDSIQVDKYCENELKGLASNMVDRDAANDGSGDHHDLITYMDRIVRCQVNQETRRTILQQIVFLGLQWSLKTSFVQDLLRGSSNYNAVDYVDAYGNTLLHLAVLSEAHNVPRTLTVLIDKMYASSAQAGSLSLIDGAWWCVSALMARNDDGKRPLDLCRSAAMMEPLKRHFRSTTSYFRFKHRRLATLSQKDNFAEVEDLLKSSATVRPQSLPTPPAAAAAPSPSSAFRETPVQNHAY